ncbi:MAG: hypothetical protein P8P48_00845 [Saprospiraceae bacterium]|nr:hypothetical protein [Saprospiraceae bacterium]
MKNISLYTLFIVLIFGACTPDESSMPDSDLTVKFKSFYGSELLVLGKTYNYLNYEVNFDKFKYIISNVELIDENNASHALSDVELIDFKDSSSEDEAAKGITFSYSGVPSGAYKAVRFDFGLGSEYLGKTPADYSSDEVLAQSELFWDSWGNYIIGKLEARFDSNNDGNFLDETFQYHLGGDDAFRTVEVPIELNLLGDGLTELVLSLDISDIVKLDNSLIDPAVYSETHSPEYNWLIDELLDNIQTLFTAN